MAEISLLGSSTLLQRGNFFGVLPRTLGFLSPLLLKVFHLGLFLLFRKQITNEKSRGYLERNYMHGSCPQKFQREKEIFKRPNVVFLRTSVIR